MHVHEMSSDGHKKINGYAKKYCKSNLVKNTEVLGILYEVQ